MVATHQNRAITKEYVNLFKTNRNLIFKSTPGYINTIRKEALSKFEIKGIPNNKVENYKYTNLEPYFRNTYNKSFIPRKIDFDINDIFKCDIPELNSHIVILINGFYYDMAHPVREVDKGIILGSFAEGAKTYPDLFKKHYSQYALYENEGLVALNTAFAQDGLFIYIPDNTVLERPVQVINLMMSDENIMAQYRNLIITGKNSQANIIICDHTLSHHKFLTNSVTEIFADKNTTLDCYKVQNEHNESAQVSNTYIYQEATSNTSFSTFTLHGGLVRNNMYVELHGEGSESMISGLYLTDKGQHVDSFTYIDHRAPHGTSNQLFKGVLNEFATAAFNGKIMVRPGAQKTIAYQKNNNILLTNDVKMHSKPQLEIYADDVKCSHGATSGRLDEDALFYLRSRGISQGEAKLLLMQAFAKEVIDYLKVKPLQERIGNLVNKRLRGELSRCNNCPIHCS